MAGRGHFFFFSFRLKKKPLYKELSVRRIIIIIIIQEAAAAAA